MNDDCTGMSMCGECYFKFQNQYAKFIKMTENRHVRECRELFAICICVNGCLCKLFAANVCHERLHEYSCQCETALTSNICLVTSVLLISATRR